MRSIKRHHHRLSSDPARLCRLSFQPDRGRRARRGGGAGRGRDLRPPERRRSSRRAWSGRPPTPEPGPRAGLRPEALLPNILTDPPAQKKSPDRLPRPTHCSGTLAEAYTRIRRADLPRRSAWMLERDTACAARSVSGGEAAVKGHPAFCVFVRARRLRRLYRRISPLPGFGNAGASRPPHLRRAAGRSDRRRQKTPPDGKAPCRAPCAPSSGSRNPSAGNCAALQPAVQGGCCRKPCGGAPAAVRPARGYAAAADAGYLLRPRAQDHRQHPGRDELVRLSALKFRRFAPETILTVSIRPEKAPDPLCAGEAGVTIPWSRLLRGGRGRRLPSRVSLRRRLPFVLIREPT